MVADGRMSAWGPGLGFRVKGFRVKALGFLRAWGPGFQLQ